MAATGRAVTSANRYADVETEALRRKIADGHRVAPEQVVLGCGSGEVLHMAVDAFVGSRKKLIVAVPTSKFRLAWARFSLTAAFWLSVSSMLKRASSTTHLSLQSQQSDRHVDRPA